MGKIGFANCQDVRNQKKMTDGVYEAFKNILAARPKFKVEPMIDGYSGFLWFDKDGKPMVAMHWEKYFKHAVDRYNSIYRVQLPKIMDMKEKKTGKGNNFPTNCREVQQMKDMEINEKIRYFRKQRGLSQELLAERTGINVNTIRKYEIGIRKPKVEQLKKIADGLEISVIEFLNIEIENEADLIAMLKKISPFFKWDGLLHVLEGEKFL